MLFDGLLHMSLPYVKQPVKAHFIDRTTWLSQHASLMLIASDHKGDQLLPRPVPLSISLSLPPYPLHPPCTNDSTMPHLCHHSV